MSEVDEVKRRLARSLNSLGAFIFDRRLINDKLVEELLVSLGVSGLLSRTVVGDIVVYYVDTRRLRKRCLYEKCSMEDVIARESCLRECLYNLEKQVLKEIIEALEGTP